ncbi:DNA-binding NarL/FixJ family response regulator [Natronocella acetinitrilica]|uniref:DNA-binding NarL/FixJ family response regulator n=1 Tax=Natronocella acetinitrilica TaxID=414046 RepID=A0AAE3G0Z5_9GAMM|nr:two-component system response regulator NarL [Natronocella acetinitrilica]MCP1673530.1 DNA-binding NarL/FixJ family response regulator [Natronocella acetinitrilica]
MTRTPIRVLVVDDHPLLRRGVEQLLELEADFEHVGEASSGEDALPLARETRPDLILLDLDMRGLGGVATLAALREAGVNARVVMLTVSDRSADVVAALRAGADGYLLKDMEPEQLLERLRQVAAGGMVVSERLAGALAQALQPPSKPHNGEDHLTGREQEILGHIARGLSNKMIARELDVTEGTIKVHVKNLLKKLGLRSRVEAAVWAVNRGAG